MADPVRTRPRWRFGMGINAGMSGIVAHERAVLHRGEATVMDAREFILNWEMTRRTDSDEEVDQSRLSPPQALPTWRGLAMGSVANHS